VATKNRSSIVVVGPFETQVYDFSSSSESGSSSGRRPSLHRSISSSSGEEPAPPVSTPAKWPAKPIAPGELLFPTPEQPNWIEYGQPVKEFEGLEMGSTSDTDSESPVKGPDIKVTTVKDVKDGSVNYKPGQEEEWNRLRVSTFDTLR
jgi:hypothetical protein